VNASRRRRRVVSLSLLTAGLTCVLAASGSSAGLAQSGKANALSTAVAGAQLTTHGQAVVRRYTPKVLPRNYRAAGRPSAFMPTMSRARYAQLKAAANAARGGKGGSAPGPQSPAVTTGVNYLGISQTDPTNPCGCVPPDTAIGVGASWVLTSVNSWIRAYHKACAGPTCPAPAARNQTLSSFFGTTDFLFDPRVAYDPIWRRFIVVATRVSASATDTNLRFYLGVSRNANPTKGWYLYTVGFGGGPFNAGDWWDFPNLGMDRNGLAITGNIFDTPAGGFKGGALINAPKGLVYNGLGWNEGIYTGLAGSLAPSIVLDGSSKMYLISAGGPGSTSFLYRYEALGSDQAVLTFQSNVTVPTWAVPPSAPQFNTTSRLDTGDGRYSGPGFQYGSNLWQVHTEALGGFSAPRWYLFNTSTNTTAGTNRWFRSGTSYDFNASIAANTSSEAFVTWTATDPPAGISNEMRISGKQSADANMTAGQSLFSTAAPYGSSGTQRWGDYSAVVLDPSPYTGCAANRRAWVQNEHTASNGGWATRIGRIGFC
jgi:hypothetical protein